MLSVFADPHEWECDYSMLARSKDRAGFPADYMANETYLNERHSRSIVGFQGNLQFIVDHLPPGSSYDLNSFLRHSWFHLYKQFLDPLQQERMLKYLAYGYDAGEIYAVNTLSEQVGGRHKFLMYCSDCVVDDKEEYGEAFWHLDHQVAGNMLCSKHGSWLQQSPVLAESRKFISADSLQLPGVPQKADLNSEEAKIYFFIAENLRYLLQAEQESDYVLLTKRYKKLLFQAGLATFTGSIRVKQLNEQFTAFFPGGFLEKLGSAIEGKNPRNWLAQVIGSQSNQHPIRHLLLLYFLNCDARQFFALDPEIKPFGEPLWPCLNPICDHYHENRIESIFIGISRKSNRQPVAKFCCPDCEYSYTRVGPDKRFEDRFKGKVISYGSKWDAYFRQLWNNSDLSLKEKAEALSIGYDTLIRQAIRLNLVDSAATSIAIKEAPLAEQVLSLQKEWLKILAENPKSGIAELIENHGDIYCL